MSEFWSAYVIALTVVTILGSFWLLFGNRTRPADSEAKTGHVYDGIEEYDHPLPAWWLHLFVVTLVFSIGYLVAYPGLGNFGGALGWSQVGQWQAEVDAAKARYEPVFARYRAMPMEEVAKDPQAVRMGQRLFANNCAQCHGADARGSRGFPNLRDADWLWGAAPDTIRTTIAAGRIAAMPPWEAALTEPGAADNLANHVLSLSGAVPGDTPTGDGAARYAALCSACHGPDGKGNPMLGAPNLTDDVWLYGGSLADVRQSILKGRNGRMPAFGEQLDADRIHLLGAYVLSLGAK
jgi:cytochrome c oxidase cbb3-type subunit 3